MPTGYKSTYRETVEYQSVDYTPPAMSVSIHSPSSQAPRPAPLRRHVSFELPLLALGIDGAVFDLVPAGSQSHFTVVF